MPKKRDRFVVTVTTKNSQSLIGIVGPFSSKAKAEGWAASAADIGRDNVLEVHQLLDPE